MGIIDTHSEHSLYDVLDGSLTTDDADDPYEVPSVDFYGFYVTPRDSKGGSYTITYDGHAGKIDRIHSEDYDDILELVDALMTYVFEAQHYDHSEDKEALVEWAGKIITEDEERAAEEPDLYLHIPEQPGV